MANELDPSRIEDWMRSAGFEPSGYSDTLKRLCSIAYLAGRQDSATDYKKWYDEAMTASNVAGFVGLSAAETIEHLDLMLSQCKAREMQMLDSIERTEMILNGADPTKLP